MARLYSALFLRLDIKWQAPMPKGPKILVANHPSVTDPFVIASAVDHPLTILIRDEVFTVPVFGEYLRRSGHIPVTAGKGRTAFDAAVATLEAGRTVLLFPEGEISPGEGRFHAARSGAARLALETGAPLIPIGVHLIWERIKTITAQINGRAVDERWYLRGPYAVTGGNPLYFSGSTEDHEHVRAVGRVIMLHIEALVNASAQRLVGAPVVLPSLATVPKL